MLVRDAICISLVFAAGIANSALAQKIADRSGQNPFGLSQGEIDNALKDCDNGSESVIAICAWDKFRRVETIYQQAERDAHNALSSSPETQGAIESADRAFERFREATCNFEISGDRMGRMATGIQYSCLESYTKRRAKALAAFAACEKTGDCQMPNLLYLDEN